MPFDLGRPDMERIAHIEKLVVSNSDAYLNHDISTIVLSMMRLDYSPTLLLQLINKMSKMGNFNKEQCVRMLEALVEKSNDEQNKKLKSQLYGKVFE